MERTNLHATLDNSTLQLTKYTGGQERKEFCKAPNASHEREVNHISRHLLTTQPMDGKESPRYRLHTRLDMNRGLEVYVEASFAGDWNKCWSEEPTPVLSRAG
eukprot:14019177-Ditylum_brightwellii.AAC.1